MKVYFLLILAALLIPALASAQKKMSSKEINAFPVQDTDSTIKTDSLPGNTDAYNHNLLADQSTGKKISMYPDNMPCLLPPKTQDHMNFFKMDTDEVKSPIDNMPNAITGKNEQPQSASKSPAISTRQSKQDGQ